MMTQVSTTSLGGYLKRANQKVTFRVDASSQIGTGHFMRCLTLADSLKQHGAKIRFVSRYLSTHLCSMLETKGHEFAILGNTQDKVTLDELAHAHWLGVSQSQDAADSIQALSDELWDWLIVDHYALDYRWESMLRQSTKKIMVIDDLADRCHDCDVLLDQNFYSDIDIRYKDKVPSHCQLLLGPRYALLRDEFRQLHDRVKPRRGPVKRLLVFFGGVDSENYTGRTVEALSKMNIFYLHVDVVVGAQHPNREEIKTVCKQYGFVCHIQTDKMAELMAVADLAIGAGGAAIWERCCLGLPTLTICTAFNQQKQIDDAAQKGFLYAPTLGMDWAILIKNHIMALIENDHLRCFLASRMIQLVDGLGVLRVNGILTCSRIEMRIANTDDSRDLFAWRNHESIRSVSREAEPITWNDHQLWFTDLMDSTSRFLLIGQIGDVPVGVVRFDKQEEVAEVSIYLVPDANHSKQGRNLLLRGEQWLKDNLPEIKYIRACVISGNEPSHRLFLGTDYLVETTNYLKKL